MTAHGLSMTGHDGTRLLRDCSDCSEADQWTVQDAGASRLFQAWPALRSVRGMQEQAARHCACPACIALRPLLCARLLPAPHAHCLLRTTRYAKRLVHDMRAPDTPGPAVHWQHTQGTHSGPALLLPMREHLSAQHERHAHHYGRQQLQGISRDEGVNFLEESVNYWKQSSRHA